MDIFKVGTGWSFTEDDRGFAQNQDDVGRDLYKYDGKSLLYI